LLAQGEVLEGEVAVAAAEEREEAKHVEQEGDHRAGIFSGSEPTDQTFGRGLSFGEGHSLPSEDAAIVLLFSLVVSGQIKLRKIDGWRKIAAVLSSHTAVAA